nr:hypothetical protein [Tanacetum cinerariifolium]
MVDEHLDTIPEIESDKFIKSSVENIIQNPSDSEDECECDVPDCDDSQMTNFSTFSNHLFDDSTSSDDESSHEEVIHEMSFKTYSNPLFDLDEGIISSEFKPIHKEDLDSTPKNDRFDTESYLLESLLNLDTLMASSPKIDSLLDEFAGELITIPLRIVNREHEEYISLMKSNDSPLLPENESFHFDVPSYPHPPAKPSDVGIFFEPNTRLLTAKVVDISECYVHLEQVANLSTYPSQHFNSFCYDDNDDEEATIQVRKYYKNSPVAITPDFSITDSLIMVDEHIDTILEIESDEFIKSSVENIIQNPSDSEDECECDVPDWDDSQTTNFSTFSNHLFDDSTSSDDESSHEKVIHEMSFKTYSNPLFDLNEGIISSEFKPIHKEDLDSTSKNDRFDTESYLLESLLNRDTLMAFSPKIDSLLDEFAGELITIPPRIVNREQEEYISLMKRLLYDNSSPRPSEEFNSKNSDAIIESFSPSPIPVEGSDSLMEEIDIFLTSDDSIPPSIENDEYYSEGDIIFFK